MPCGVRKRAQILRNGHPAVGVAGWRVRRADFEQPAAVGRIGVSNSTSSRPVAIAALFRSRLSAQGEVGKQAFSTASTGSRPCCAITGPSENISRASRREISSALQRLPVEEVRRAARRTQLHAVITGPVDQADRFELEEGEWVDPLEIDLRKGDFTSCGDGDPRAGDSPSCGPRRPCWPGQHRSLCAAHATGPCRRFRRPIPLGWLQHGTRRGCIVGVSGSGRRRVRPGGVLRPYRLGGRVRHAESRRGMCDAHRCGRAAK